jgi:hypothetical protein
MHEVSEQIAELPPAQVKDGAICIPRIDGSSGCPHSVHAINRDTSPGAHNSEPCIGFAPMIASYWSAANFLEHTFRNA